MLIKKEKLKKMINEELGRIGDQDTEGHKAAVDTIQVFDSLNESQKINFLEKFFFHLKENKNI